MTPLVTTSEKGLNDCKIVNAIGKTQISENIESTPIATRWPVLLFSPVTI
jgi:hypothetical protein